MYTYKLAERESDQFFFFFSILLFVSLAPVGWSNEKLFEYARSFILTRWYIFFLVVTWSQFSKTREQHRAVGNFALPTNWAYTIDRVSIWNKNIHSLSYKFLSQHSRMTNVRFKYIRLNVSKIYFSLSFILLIATIIEFALDRQSNINKTEKKINKFDIFRSWNRRS